MTDLRIVISDPKTGKSVQREVKEDATKPFFGLKLGQKVKGELLDLTGFEFTLTGGSDDSGFPMRRDIEGTAKKRILATGGVGINKKLRKGMRIRKTVAGNTVGAQTAQINLKIEKAGKEDLFPKPEAPAEEKKEEAKKEEPKEEKKEEPKAEEKPAEKKEEKKKEVPKEEKKEEKAAPEEKKKEEKKE